MTVTAAKMEDNLGKLNEAAIRPWVLLSAGEKFDLFTKQVEMSMKAGCAGYGIAPKDIAASVKADWYLDGAKAGKQAEVKGDY
jgi:tagatose-1,6-bisphosphate aldolase